MGWWPTKLIVVLNLIVLLGYCLIDCVIVGQILSAVSPNGSLSVVVGRYLHRGACRVLIKDSGIIIAAIITWVVSTFGISALHFYERCVALWNSEGSHLTIPQDMQAFLNSSSSVFSMGSLPSTLISALRLRAILGLYQATGIPSS